MLQSKFWQAFFALAPIIAIFIAVIGYFVFFFSLMKNIPHMEGADLQQSEMFFAGIGTFMIFVFLAVIISLGSLVFYIIHAVQNPNLKENNLLVVWILLFVFVSGIGQLIYWIIEIINKRNQNITP